MLTMGAALLRANIARFAASFTILFWLAYGCWALGSYAYIAVKIWERFPKFVLGFAATFLIVLLIGLRSSTSGLASLNAAMDQANVFRQLFFVLTFFCIGLMADLRVLWQEGIGRLAAVYVVSLFGFVIWAGLLISWIFFSGLKPPIAG